VQAPNPPLEGENISNTRDAYTCIDSDKITQQLYLDMYASQSDNIHI